jgi:hypothetical protein
MTPVLIVLIIFGSIASLFIVPQYLRSVERQKLQDTLRAAIEKGQPLPPDVVQAMTTDVKPLRSVPSAARDLRTGIVWLGVAVGLAAMGVLIGFEEPDATYPMIGIAAFPGFIGLAFVIMSVIARDRK